MSPSHRRSEVPGAGLLSSRLYRILFIALLIATLGWLDDSAVVTDAGNAQAAGQRHDR